MNWLEGIAQGITSLAAVGALVVSFYAWKSSKEVPERVQELQGSQAHDHWLREQRLRIYVEFLELATKAKEQAHLEETNDDDWERAAKEHQTPILESKFHKLRLVASKEVREAAQQFVLVYATNADTWSSSLEDTLNLTKYREAATRDIQMMDDEGTTPKEK